VVEENIKKYQMIVTKDWNQNLKFYQILIDKIGGLWNTFLIVCNISIVEPILSLNRLTLLWSSTFFEGRLASFEEVGTLVRLAWAKPELRLLLAEFS